MSNLAHNTPVRADQDTLFVLGNGPSLGAVDLTRLTPYATIGLNAAYRYWREIDWRPTHYACLDLVVGLSHKDAIAELIEEGRIKNFLLRDNLVEALGAKAFNERIINFDSLRASYGIFETPAITTGSHAALWGAFAGFKKIVILGVDAQYKEIVSGAKKREGIELEIVEADSNPNYFFDGYQQPGDRYNLPNPRPDLHVDAWRYAGRIFLDLGVNVYNANPQSAVRVFPFIDLDKFLGAGARSVPADEKAPALPASEIAKSPARRIQRFVRGNAGLLTGVFAALVCITVLLSVLGVNLTPLIFTSSLFYFLFVLTMYTRMAIIDHLGALQTESDRLKVVQRDWARLVAASQRHRR